MTKVSLASVALVSVAIEFDCVGYRGDDGYDAAKLFDVVVLQMKDGRQFYIPNHKFVNDEESGVNFPVPVYDPSVIIGKILAKRWVDLDNWVLIEEISLEERLEVAYMEEQHDRAMWH